MSKPEEIPNETLADAAKWMNEYIYAQEEIETTCVMEGMSDEEWKEHLHFVAECFLVGVKPTHFLDVLIKAQKDFNNSQKADAA